MSETAVVVPQGYELFPLDGSFNDAFAPMFMALTDEGPQIALRVEKKHLNPMGILHGSVYMAIFDIAFACVIGHTLGKYAGTPTVNINIDYLSAAREGELLIADVECTKIVNTLGFARGVIRSEKGEKASASGVFKLPANLDAVSEMGVITS